MVPRLKQRRDFLAVADAGEKWITPFFVLQKSQHKSDDEDTDKPPMRVGFTVTKKMGSAVVRNRIRRRMRALVDEMMLKHAKPGHDYVLIGRVAAKTCDFEELRKNLLWALGKLDVLVKT